MEYEGQICRPPMERSSFMLPVAVGCSYNRCTFCTLFKHLRYRQLPIEQVEAELQRVHDAGGNPEQVFLGDGNAFCMSTDHLLRILELVHRYLPGLQDGQHGRHHHQHQPKERRGIKAAVRPGGLPPVYRHSRPVWTTCSPLPKRITICSRPTLRLPGLQQAGLVFNAHIMTGIAGRGRGKENR